MTQLSLVASGAAIGRTLLEAAARTHARRHGLVFVRVELSRDLLGQPEEIAVLRRADGGLVRRTADMIQQAKGV